MVGLDSRDNPAEYCVIYDIGRDFARKYWRLGWGDCTRWNWVEFPAHLSDDTPALVGNYSRWSFIIHCGDDFVQQVLPSNMEEAGVGVFFLGLGLTFLALTRIQTEKGLMKWPMISGGILLAVGVLFILFGSAAELFPYIGALALIVVGWLYPLAGHTPQRESDWRSAMSDDNPKKGRREKPPSIFFPLLLIALGVYFLLINLGVMEGNFWSTVWQLWPVLLIAGGIEGIIRRDNLVTSAFFAAIGTVFLLCNFDYLDYSILQLIIYLWPLLLVALGIDVLIGKRSIWFSLAGAGILLVILFGAVVVDRWSFTCGNRSPGLDISQPLNGAERAAYDLQIGAGSLTLDALTSENILIEGSVPTSEDFKVDQSYTVVSGEGIYDLKTPGEFAFAPGIYGNDLIWILKLNDAIPGNLDLELGAGDATVTLTSLLLESISISLGAGQSSIYLPKQGGFSADIGLAVGAMTIYVPEGLAVRINSDTGLTAVTAPEGYLKQGDAYVSPDYSSNSNRAELRISNGLGTVKIAEK